MTTRGAPGDGSASRGGCEPSGQDGLTSGLVSGLMTGSVVGPFDGTVSGPVLLDELLQAPTASVAARMSRASRALKMRPPDTVFRTTVGARS